jgi:UDP:flavonoid glycosyltransferase YjiC (YdhE family)
VRLPGRLLGPRGLALAVGRALARPQLREGARALQAWSVRHPGPARAADLVEAFAAATAG